MPGRAMLRRNTMARLRLDQLMTARGLAPTREKAQRLIRAGQVRWRGRVVDKPAHPCREDDDIAVQQPERFVGRGGYKLEAAFDIAPVRIEERAGLDIGASTGGFTDCLLQHGARHVYAVDVGHGQLDWTLRNDPRVTVMDRTNARYLEPGLFSEPLHFAAVDVSFISLTKILPAVTGVVEPDSWIMTLIKPQFEAGRTQVARGGVVRDASIREQVVEDVRHFGEHALRLQWIGCGPSPIQGPAGNVEYMAVWKKS